MNSATRELVNARHVCFNNLYLLQFLRKPSALALASHRAVLQVDGFHALRCDMNINQYKELASMVEMAEENQGTMRFGAHFFLKKYLKENFGVTTGDNKNTIKKARQLLDEFLTAYTSED
jgi:hypothetical protein